MIKRKSETEAKSYVWIYPPRPSDEAEKRQAILAREKARQDVLLLMIESVLDHEEDPVTRQKLHLLKSEIRLDRAAQEITNTYAPFEARPDLKTVQEACQAVEMARAILENFTKTHSVV